MAMSLILYGQSNNIIQRFDNVKACVILEDGNYQLIYEDNTMEQRLSAQGVWSNRIICNKEAEMS